MVNSVKKRINLAVLVVIVLSMLIFTSCSKEPNYKGFSIVDEDGEIISFDSFQLEDPNSAKKVQIDIEDDLVASLEDETNPDFCAFTNAMYDITKRDKADVWLRFDINKPAFQNELECVLTKRCEDLIIPQYGIDSLNDDGDSFTCNMFGTYNFIYKPKPPEDTNAIQYCAVRADTAQWEYDVSRLGSVGAASTQAITCKSDEDGDCWSGCNGFYYKDNAGTLTEPFGPIKIIEKKEPKSLTGLGPEPPKGEVFCGFYGSKFSMLSYNEDYYSPKDEYAGFNMPFINEAEDWDGNSYMQWIHYICSDGLKQPEIDEEYFYPLRYNPEDGFFWYGTNQILTSYASTLTSIPTYMNDGIESFGNAIDQLSEKYCSDFSIKITGILDGDDSQLYRDFFDATGKSLSPITVPLQQKITVSQIEYENTKYNSLIEFKVITDLEGHPLKIKYKLNDVSKRDTEEETGHDGLMWKLEATCSDEPPADWEEKAFELEKTSREDCRQAAEVSYGLEQSYFSQFWLGDTPQAGECCGDETSDCSMNFENNANVACNIAPTLFENAGVDTATIEPQQAKQLGLFDADAMPGQVVRLTCKEDEEVYGQTFPFEILAWEGEWKKSQGKCNKDNTYYDNTHQIGYLPYPGGWGVCYGTRTDEPSGADFLREDYTEITYGGTPFVAGEQVDCYINERQTYNYYCSASGEWITDVDSDELTCGLASGFDDPNVAHGWTGTQCCGDPEDYRLFDRFSEKYNDPGTEENPATAACLMSYPTFNDDFFYGSYLNNYIRKRISDGVAEEELPYTEEEFTNRFKAFDERLIVIDGTFHECELPEDHPSGWTEWKDDLTGKRLIKRHKECDSLQGEQRFWICNANEKRWENTFEQNLSLYPGVKNLQNVPETQPEGVRDFISYSGCCREDQCWNGVECIDDQSISSATKESQPYVGTDGAEYRCLDGTWRPSIEGNSWDYTQSGFCKKGECYVGTGLQVDPNIEAFTRGKECVASGTIIGDHYCGQTADGKPAWITRTKMVANQLLSIVPPKNDFTLVCAPYSKVLNELDYTLKAMGGVAVVPKAYFFDQSHCADSDPSEEGGLCVNNVCVLNWKDKMIIGTSHNIPINDKALSFLFALGRSYSACRNVLQSGTDKLGKCDGAGKGSIYYDPVSQTSYFSADEFVFTQGNPMFTNMRLTNKIQDLYNFVLDGINSNYLTPLTGAGTSLSFYDYAPYALDIDRLFWSKKGETKIYGVQSYGTTQAVKKRGTKIEPVTKEFMAIRYENFPVDMCQYIDPLRAYACNTDGTYDDNTVMMERNYGQPDSQAESPLSKNIDLIQEGYFYELTQELRLR